MSKGEQLKLSTKQFSHKFVLLFEIALNANSHFHMLHDYLNKMFFIFLAKCKIFSLRQVDIYVSGHQIGNIRPVWISFQEMQLSHMAQRLRNVYFKRHTISGTTFRSIAKHFRDAIFIKEQFFLIVPNLTQSKIYMKNESTQLSISVSELCMGGRKIILDILKGSTN